MRNLKALGFIAVFAVVFGTLGFNKNSDDLYSVITYSDMELTNEGTVAEAAIFEAVGNAFRQVGQATRRAVGQVGQATRRVVGQAGQATRRVVGQAGQATRRVVGQAGQATRRVGQATRRATRATLRATARATRRTARATRRIVETVGNATELTVIANTVDRQAVEYAQSLEKLKKQQVRKLG